MLILDSEEFVDLGREAANLIALKVLDCDLEDAIELIRNMRIEKEEKEAKSDSLIDYNDEIVSIVDVGEKECVDIQVTGDNLFYCNDILTKNSVGTPQTSDWFCALIMTEEMAAEGKMMMRQLKSRYDNIDRKRRFMIGIDKMRMRLYGLEDDESSRMVKDVPASARAPEKSSEPSKKREFANFT